MSLLRKFANEYAALKGHAFCPTGEGGGIDNSCSPTGEPGKSTEPQGQKRAKVGGEIGPNNEWYPGGAFIATTDLPKMLKRKIDKAAGDKIEIEPYKWVVPQPGQMSLMEKLGHVDANLHTGQVNEQYMDYLKLTSEQRTKYRGLMERWKSGERFVSINEFPELANFKDMARLISKGHAVPGAALDKLPADVREKLQKFKPKP